MKNRDIRKEIGVEKLNEINDKTKVRCFEHVKRKKIVNIKTDGGNDYQ